MYLLCLDTNKASSGDNLTILIKVTLIENKNIRSKKSNIQKK